MENNFTPILSRCLPQSAEWGSYRSQRAPLGQQTGTGTSWCPSPGPISEVSASETVLLNTTDTRWNIIDHTPLCVPLDSTKKKVSTRSESSRNAISNVSTSKLKEKITCIDLLPFLPDLYHGGNLSGNIVLRLGQSWMICVFWGGICISCLSK